MAARLETDLHAQQEEYRVLPLLQERVELLRAERQRLEDRTSRNEESIADAVTRLEREEDFTAHVDARMKTFEARVEHVHAVTLDFRRSLTRAVAEAEPDAGTDEAARGRRDRAAGEGASRAGDPAQERGRMTSRIAPTTPGDMPLRGVLHRYADHLPITDKTPIISLGEGDTPLVRSMSIERDLGCEALYFKLESCNPTGSFKDRGMVVAIAKAMESGAKAVMCASTGNTSASAAAYAARYGLKAYVIVPDGNIARGKLAQSAVYGAEIIAVDGNFDAALRAARANHGETPDRARELREFAPD